MIIMKLEAHSKLVYLRRMIMLNINDIINDDVCVMLIKYDMNYISFNYKKI